MAISQILIFITGVPAIYLVSRKDKWQKYGYIFGLMGQPIWVYITLTQAQYGMFALTVVYTFSWINGVYNHWIKKN